MTDQAAEARLQVRRAVTEMTGGTGAPLEALRALVSLRAALAQAERDAARRAREAGRTWGEIGEALGFADRPGLRVSSAAERAFLTAASDLGTGPVFAWTCQSCGQVVTDRGPETGHPADQETGHGNGCKRFTATVKAWNAQWDDADG